MFHFQREMTFLQHLNQQQYSVRCFKRLGSFINVKINHENI